MKTTIYALFLLLSLNTYAQVGINTNQPQTHSILDINSQDKGILIPRVQLTSIFDTTTVKALSGSVSTYENSLLVYNTITSNLKNEKDVVPGFYYWETDRWVRMITQNQQQFFYMPSIIIPTAADQIQPKEVFGQINLYEKYEQQFSKAATKNPSSSTKLPVFLKNQLDYYITWYDDSVFSDVKVSDTGVLSYKIKPNADVSIGSFMNIVFVVK